jgi:chemotaxis protein histidine kinase CheA
MRDIKDVLLLLQHSPADVSIASTLPGTKQIIEDKTDFDEYKHVVALLCAIEAVLNRVRDAELRPKADLIALLFICINHISRMVSQIACRDEIYLGYLNRSHGLIRQLRDYQGRRFNYAAA